MSSARRTVDGTFGIGRARNRRGVVADQVTGTYGDAAENAAAAAAAADAVADAAGGRVATPAVPAGVFSALEEIGLAIAAVVVAFALPR